MHARKSLLTVMMGAVAGAAALLAVPAGAEVVPQRLIDVMGAPAAAAAVEVTLSATLSGGGPTGPIEWSVFARSNDAVGALAASGRGETLAAALPPGQYVAHIGIAGTSSVRSFAVTEAGGPEPFVLAIGAVSLDASSNGMPLDRPDAVAFTIYDTGDGREAIRRDIRPDETVVLPAGVYRAVVRYGDHNALTGADIRVKPGEVTRATLGVSGAPVRLSLVREGSTAALAAVHWRVFDDGGKPIMDTDLPSPSLVLAPGAYTAEVLHDGWTGVHRFEVASGTPLDLKLPAGE